MFSWSLFYIYLKLSLLHSLFFFLHLFMILGEVPTEDQTKIPAPSKFLALLSDLLSPLITLSIWVPPRTAPCLLL